MWVPGGYNGSLVQMGFARKCSDISLAITLSYYIEKVVRATSEKNNLLPHPYIKLHEKFTSRPIFFYGSNGSKLHSFSFVAFNGSITFDRMEGQDYSKLLPTNKINIFRQRHAYLAEFCFIISK